MVGADRGPRQAPERRQVFVNRIDLILIHVFIVRKEKQFVLQDRPAYPNAWIPSREERVRVLRVALKAWIRCHIVIAEEKISASVKIVAAAARYDVDLTACPDSRRDIEIDRRDLELLNDLLRKIHVRCPGAFPLIIDDTAIDCESRIADAAESRH